MKHRPTLSRCTRPLLVLLLAGAAGSSLAARATDVPATPVAPSPATPAAPQMPPGHPATGGMPMGHPGMPPGHGGMGGGMGAPAPGGERFAMPVVDPGAGQGAKALVWQTPADWIAEPPSNPMRRAQLRVPGPGGEAQCVVFYFGPGEGGDPQGNAERWAGQFEQTDGRPPLAAMKTSTLDVGGMQVRIVETTGTYLSGSMMGGPPVSKPDWALLGAVAPGPDANWFFKLTGPRATVEAQRPAFEAMIRSLRKGS